jgi:phenylpropionate dioxygenase-like ring-hydroxylating dioxygenase large terminal subunit
LYPFATDRAIVRNRWYIAAFSSEVSRSPVERTLLGIPVVLYRTEAGTPVAMYGLCPHRYYPLARGRLDGDSIVCNYHGFTFGSDGKCVMIPSQGTGAGFSQPTYRVEERGPLLWIWMGDADRCDLGLIPPYDDFGLDQPGWRSFAFNHLQIRGRYQLLVDNLMDLTHIEFVHNHIPGGEALTNTSIREEERPASYRTERLIQMPSSDLIDTLYGAEARYEGSREAIVRTDFYGPELIRTGWPLFAPVNGRNALEDGLGTFWIMHGITPESEHSTHYFGFSTRDYRLDDEELDAWQLASDIYIRGQDIVAIEAVEPRLDWAAGRQRELLARLDGSAIKVRRKIQVMLDSEA